VLVGVGTWFGWGRGHRWAGYGVLTSLTRINTQSALFGVIIRYIFKGSCALTGVFVKALSTVCIRYAAGMPEFLPFLYDLLGLAFLRVFPRAPCAPGDSPAVRSTCCKVGSSLAASGAGGAGARTPTPSTSLSKSESATSLPSVSDPDSSEAVSSKTKGTWR
jgi:hypothetical protein